MSFILDALKKSESDRQRQSGPSLFEVKVAPPRRTLPVWAVAIAVLLGINVIVISWMLLRHPGAPQPAAAQPATVSPQTTAVAPSPGHAAVQDAPATRTPATPPDQSSADSGRAPSTTAAAAAVVASSADRSANATQPATPAPPADGSAAQRAGQATSGGNPGQASSGDNPSDYAPAVEPGTAAGSAATTAAAGDLPLYQQIVTSDGLPDLHLDLHVFADRPQDRFVMINMHRLGEGDSLPGGVRVEAIRPDGVVLSYRGTRFLLPRN
jgi:general secretion pathway protein B